MVRIVLGETEAKWLLYFLDKADSLMMDAGCHDLELRFNEENKAMLKRIYAWEENVAEPELDRNNVEIDRIYAALDGNTGRFKHYVAPYFLVLDYLISDIESQASMTVESATSELT